MENELDPQVIRCQPLLSEACEHLGLQDAKIIVIKGSRWTIDFDQDPLKPDFGQNMIKLETLLQQATRSPIDLRLAPFKDKNKRFDRNYLRGVDKL